ncbi:MAG: DUF92 domain-containing protein, partial [Bacteroidetes bacterium QH_2_63_10]
VEAISHRGWDNLFVVAAVIVLLVPIQEQALGPVQLAAALVVGGAFGGLAYSTNALDGHGAATGGLFAASLMGLGGWPWIVPGIVFFGLSSALTSMEGPDRFLSGEAPCRTQAQVLANGGVAWTSVSMIAVLPPGTSAASTVMYAAFVGALAAAAADTWATELGAWAPSPPRSLRDGHRVPPGTSGAITGVGTGAALLGAASVVGAALLAGGPLAGPAFWSAALLVGAGMLGMGADSVAGAFLQAHYQASSEQLIETPPSSEATPVRGWAGIGNNAVNLIGTAVGALVAVAGTILVG